MGLRHFTHVTHVVRLSHLIPEFATDVAKLVNGFKCFFEPASLLDTSGRLGTLVRPVPSTAQAMLPFRGDISRP